MSVYLLVRVEKSLII
ncbi:hypothetical protein JTS96_09375 [Clostridium botulinum]|nr:hypothetical protein [Clostridium botulinum]MCS4467419.1 hypothetical protein [Clostridium botulinum]MCS4468632.1 hypothetical protein [Clostridium botulinum]